LIGVDGFGETEYWLSLLKVLAIVFFIVFGIAVWLGASSLGFLGFKNWTQPIIGDTPIAQFTNLAGAFVTAFYSYGGTELVGITAYVV
jgi:lysine-specific permease